MKFKSLSWALALAVVFSTGAVFAQDAPAPAKEEKKESKAGTFSGVGFFEYNYDVKGDYNGNGTEEDGMFALKRAYLTYKNDIGDKLSVKVTLDAGEWNAGSDKVGVFLKNAYFQYKDEFAGVNVTTQAGVIGTPLIGITDKMGGMRWLTSNQMDMAKIDNSADTGVGLELDFMGFATLYGTLTNGEGYKRFQSNSYKGMAIDTVLSITPIKGLFINGYFRNEYEAKDDKDQSFGAGLAWSDKMYKTGVNYIYVTEPAGTSNDKGSYIDGWVNVNLNDAVSLPVLVLGRVMYFTPKDSAVDSTTGFFFGPGYQFNDNLQTAALFGYSKSESADDADMNISVKFEFKY